MVNPQRATKLIRDHFAQLTPQQFIENLKQACPEVFEEEKDKQIKGDSSSCKPINLSSKNSSGVQEKEFKEF